MIVWSEKDMLDFGKKIAISWYKNILIYGDLGVGKTHFVKWFVSEVLKKNKSQDFDVKSPTYTYTNLYLDKVSHFDFYRVEDDKLLQSYGLIDLIEQYEYVLIERPKFEEKYINIKTDWFKIYITKLDNDNRQVDIVYHRN